jgi:mannose-6-phosphate isomerase
MSGARDERPWGSWLVLDQGSGYQVKRLLVRPGERISYQTHAHRAEHWTVAHGTATCVIDGETVELTPGTSVDVPVGTPHRLANLHDDTLIVIEVQRGTYFGEDDIVRLEDDYGRLEA